MSTAEFEAFCRTLSPTAKERVARARRHIVDDAYELRLRFVTTGRCSKGIKADARGAARRANRDSVIEIIDAPLVISIMADYLLGVAPAIASLPLPLLSDNLAPPYLQVIDAERGIVTTVIRMTGDAIAKLHHDAGDRLFARNVRGFVGSAGNVNKRLVETITKRPYDFWYFNNGITIVCDAAELDEASNILTAVRPQIINGQQTTRVLSEHPREDASVLVKIMAISRGANSHYERLLTDVVQATNWQNAIRMSDLMANDQSQIDLERDLRKYDYQYIRKRQSKGEARRVRGAAIRFHLTKFELAYTVAACDLDPSVPFLGSEALFEDERYARLFRKKRSIFQLLARFWLWRCVMISIRKRPRQLRYTRWLAVHILWDHLKEELKDGGAERFVRICEREKAPDGLIFASRNLCQWLAGSFYRGNRKSGDRDLETAAFFRQGALVDKYKTSWKRKENHARLKFNDYLERTTAHIARG